MTFTTENVEDGFAFVLFIYLFLPLWFTLVYSNNKYLSSWIILGDITQFSGLDQYPPNDDNRLDHFLFIWLLLLFCQFLFLLFHFFLISFPLSLSLSFLQRLFLSTILLAIW